MTYYHSAKVAWKSVYRRARIRDQHQPYTGAHFLAVCGDDATRLDFGSVRFFRSSTGIHLAAHQPQRGHWSRIEAERRAELTGFQRHAEDKARAAGVPIMINRQFPHVKLYGPDGWENVHTETGLDAFISHAAPACTD